MEERIAIITPCFNESDTVIRFLMLLERTLSHIPYHFTVVVVDDCSTDDTLELLKDFAFRAHNMVLDVVTLAYNLGHQRAIYQGLLYSQSLDASQFVVMDSDGEDDPYAILELLTQREADIVHVVRGKRSERPFFRMSYYFYKVIFRFINRQNMNFGNYCMINRKVLDMVVHTSFVHFAAYLSKVRVKHAYVTFDRLKRIGGDTKMNTGSLVFHAFKSLVEYAENLLQIFLKLFVALAAAFWCLVLYVLYQKLFTDDAVLDWVSTVLIGLFNTALISIGFYVIGILLLNIADKRNLSSKRAVYERVSDNYADL